MNQIKNKEYNDAAIVALTATQILIDEGLANGSFLAPGAASQGNVMQVTSGLVTAMSTDPIITPEEQSDIKVKALTTGVINVEYTGDIGVENDTQLYLSTKITESSSNKELYPHISSYFDANMVGPQGLGLLFWASTKDDYNQSNFRDATVEILTPGIAGFERGDLSVHNYLMFRTFIDRVILPIINQAVGNIFKPKDLTNILISNAGNAVNTFGTLMNNGDVKGAFKAIVTVILDDVRSVPPGPITQAIAKRLGKTAVKEILEKLAARISAKLVPIVGQLSLVVEVLGAVNTATNVAKTFDDLIDTPALLDFTVDWPLEITDMSPKLIKPEPAAVNLTIEGQGFAPINTGIIFDNFINPEVTLTDEGTNGFGSITIEPTYITPDGTSMMVTILGMYAAQAVGPISVTVKHDDATASADPIKIEVDDELRIDSITPDSGGSGTVVFINGIGFSNNRLDNNVTFANENGGRSSALIVASSTTGLSVVAPPDVATGPVTVEVGNQISNEVQFEVSTVSVSINFGDNGTANDDTFALFVNGTLIHSMPSPTRSAGPFDLDLVPGEHNVTLRGITAPDDIGTYFISFSGVTVLSGDPLTGDDLTAGVEKHYVIQVDTNSRISQLLRNTPASIKPKNIPLIWAE